jgi:glucose/arabinose dehydrogenase
MRIPRRPLAGSIAVLSLVAPSMVDAVVQVPAWFVNETVVGSLHHPNSMAFLPDGRLLFTEQESARVRMVVNDHIAATDPALTVSGVTHAYERGLQGIAVDPAWPLRPFIYLYFTHNGERNVVARFTGQGDLSDSSGENLTFTDRLELIGDIPDHDPNHNAGCLRFGTDGCLYVSIGEDYDMCGAQDSTALKGQILRIRVDQIPATPPASVPRALLIPSGNPFASPDSNASLVWAHGLRNPWRFHIDRPTGYLYVADVGANDFEELDEVSPGDNLGWPLREGNKVWPNSSCPEPGGAGGGGYRPPIATYANGSGEAVIFTAGTYRAVPGASHNWPSSHWGDVFYGDFFRGWLKRLEKVGGVWQAAPQEQGQPSATEWATGMIGAVDFQVGPDGTLWWMRWGDDALADESGSIERIRYVGTDTTSAIQISLVHARATPDEVRLEWYVADSGFSATLQRRPANGAWNAITTVVSDGAGHMVYVDHDVEPGRAYDYRLVVVEGGLEQFHAETRIDVPARLDLAVRGVRRQAGAMIIAFSVPATAPVRLEFLDITGRRVLERDLGSLDAGSQLVSLGNVDLDSGVYLARITQSGRRASGKAVIVR